MTTLYEALKAANIDTEHHESDLYVPSTPKTRELLAKFDKTHATTFHPQLKRMQMVAGTWFDVPFAYDPFWAAVARRLSP